MSVELMAQGLDVRVRSVVPARTGIERPPCAAYQARFAPCTAHLQARIDLFNTRTH
jgi:hypothetical protein